MPECLLNKTNIYVNRGLNTGNALGVFTSNADTSFRSIIEASVGKCVDTSSKQYEFLLKNLTITMPDVNQQCSPLSGLFLSCVHLEVFLVSPESN